MKLQLLISAVNQKPQELIKKMNVRSSAILINQGDKNGYEEFKVENGLVRAYSFAEKGVGLSRNNALFRADCDISLFADEDIIYCDSSEDLVLQEFAAHPEAVHLYNCGRYPAYSFALRTEVMHRKNVCYSLLFGGGARYSNGEDSLFIRDCIRSGMHVYKTPVTIGREEERDSTWFSGYHEKFFFDRGVLYAFLYGWLAGPMALQFLLRHKNVMCREIPVGQAYALMRKGILEAGR